MWTIHLNYLFVGDDVFQVRVGAGVHTVAEGGEVATRMARGRIPRPPGPILLRNRSRQGMGPWHRERSLQGLPVRWHQDQRYQRRSDARTMGVPSRPHRGYRSCRPVVGCQVHLGAYHRNRRSGLVLGPQAHRGWLERRRMPHQLQVPIFLSLSMFAAICITSILHSLINAIGITSAFFRFGCHIYFLIKFSTFWCNLLFVCFLLILHILVQLASYLLSQQFSASLVQLAFCLLSLRHFSTPTVVLL